MSNDDLWMARALELARRGEALASPNPMVGAVLVRGGRKIAEGFHTYTELDHAEIVALRKAGSRARGATLYVSLEPCCHTGRTGPCTQAILRAGVRRVIAAMRDPNPRVAGRGIAQLRRAGVRVDCGVLEAEAQRLNEAFARWITAKRPFVTLKSALTLDGQIVAPGARGRRRTITWITSPQSRAEVQRIRHAHDALLTGIGTVLADDPRLSDRSGLPRRRRLLRVVMDSRLRMPLDSKLARSADGDLLVVTTSDADSPRGRRLRAAGVEVMRVAARRGRPDLRAVMKELARRDILSVLIEAGGQLNGAALEAGVVDKMILFYAPRILGVTTVPVASGRAGALAAVGELHNLNIRRFGPDFCVEGYFSDVYRNH